MFRLEQIEAGTLVNTSALLFAHTETVMPFVTSLGLFKDAVPLTVGLSLLLSFETSLGLFKDAASLTVSI
jgi:hypothetical protein